MRLYEIIENAKVGDKFRRVHNDIELCENCFLCKFDKAEVDF